MNLRETIAKQQEVWITKLDGKPHGELVCPLCERLEEDDEERCGSCPVVRLLVPDWTVALSDACYYLPSWRRWFFATTIHERAAAARLVLADVNKIARHYHYKVRWE
jgi:hypothetical protein